MLKTKGLRKILEGLFPLFPLIVLLYFQPSTSALYRESGGTPGTRGLYFHKSFSTNDLAVPPLLEQIPHSLPLSL